MADNTAIEWADASWNPIRARDKATGKIGWFCTHASDGCRFCYAEVLNRRLGTRIDYRAQDIDKVEVFLDEKMLTQPLRWQRSRKIFVCSMSDLFGEFIPDEMIDRVFAVMALAPQHVFIVLTKRADRMHRHCANEYGAWPGRVFPYWVKMAVEKWGVRFKEPQRLAFPLPNCWNGVSVEDQARADERIPLLLDTPAAKRFISAEPLLGPVDITRYLYDGHRCIITGYPARHPYACGDCDPCLNAFGFPVPRGLSWAIVGGESGPGARPMSIQWARSLRDQCQSAGVPFFFKQFGEWAPAGGGPSGRPGRFAFGDYEHDPCTMIECDGYPRQFTMFGARSVMQRVGKAKAGRLLDGREHSEFPAQ